MDRIVICGCGHFGKNITKHLLRYDNYITVVDQDKELVTHMSNTLDVKGIHGFVSHPETLKEAGQTDILIAATSMDEINMVACEVAHALFDTPLKMARVRSQTYFTSQYDLIFQDKNLSIDEILSPEIDAADYVTKTLSVPGSNDVISFDVADIIVVTLDAGAPACHTQVDGLPRLLSEGDVEILAIHRAEETFLPQSNTTLLPGDEVYFLCQTESIEKSVLLFKKTASPTNRIILFGGGNFGFALGQKLESTFDHKEITVIEPLESQAHALAENFNKINVICGDLFDHDLLKEVDVNNADIVACTNDDKVNLLSALLAKKLGAKRALSLISTASYEPLVRSIGINGVCNPAHPYSIKNYSTNTNVLGAQCFHF